MNRIIDVKALENYRILVIYQNGEKRIKDMKPYLEKGVFKKSIMTLEVLSDLYTAQAALYKLRILKKFVINGSICHSAVV